MSSSMYTKAYADWNFSLSSYFRREYDFLIKFKYCIFAIEFIQTETEIYSYVIIY